MQQRRQRPDSATLIGSGKVEELQGAVASVAPDLVIFDYELTPSQQRNLERELHVRVIDRTQLILDIFARHARTREGQLQVELAQLEYLLPRLAGRGVEMSQLGRRYRHSRTRRNATRNRSPENLSSHSPREGSSWKASGVFAASSGSDANLCRLRWSLWWDTPMLGSPRCLTR